MVLLVKSAAYALDRNLDIGTNLIFDYTKQRGNSPFDYAWVRTVNDWQNLRRQMWGNPVSASGNPDFEFIN